MGADVRGSRSIKEAATSLRGRTAWLLAAATLGVVLTLIGIGATRIGSRGQTDPPGALQPEGASAEALPPSPTPSSTPTPQKERGELIGFPPPGAEPSQPAVGKLVVGFSAEDVTGYESQINTGVFVYADGRVIWRRESCDGQSRCQPLVGPKDRHEPNTGWLEQRLTPQGVELLHSELLATDLFRRDLLRDSNAGNLVDYVSVDVRSGARLVSAEAQPGFIGWPKAPTNAQVRALEHAQEILMDLDSWLPHPSWADRSIHAFIPSRYCLSFYPKPPRQPSDLPSPADELVSGKFTNLSTDEARAVAKGLRSADNSRARSSRALYSVGYRLTLPQHRRTTLLLIEPSLPGGGTTC